MASGIYRIRVERGDKPPRFYIGQAFNLKRRSIEHFNQLRRGSHKNQILQRAFRKYGEAAFSFETLVVCAADVAILSTYELSIINIYRDDEIYNICRQSVGSKLGVRMSAETKAKIGAANKGNVISEAHRESVRRASRGRKQSPETIEKRRVKMLGNKCSAGKRLTEERKIEIGNFFRGKKRPAEVMDRVVATRRANAEARGYWRSPEDVEKTAKKLRGRKHTAEHCAKISAAGRGRKLSEEHKKVLADFHRGRPKSSEVRAKISDSLKERSRLKHAMDAYALEAM